LFAGREYLRLDNLEHVTGTVFHLEIAKLVTLG
jgi:hypothetical protein